MADKDDVKKERGKAKEAAKKDLKVVRRTGFPVAPRKASSEANKRSKRLMYPLAPYPGTNIFVLWYWAWKEWKSLGKWQRVAIPVIILVALLTWEKETALQEEYIFQIDRSDLKRQATDLYVTEGKRPERRKLFGIIPLPGGR